ncbi:MAG: hypothetical protein BWY02_02869 [bacterium ADurb.Bin157]|nr:MAG: hypothetical protein BWY02_02869 [bacterium ADurb.Bin157]
MKLRHRPAVGGARLTRRLSALLKGRSVLKTAYETIDCVYTSRRFLNAPISLDFKHTLSAGSPKVTEDYHISSYDDWANDGILFDFVLGIRSRRFSIFVDRMVIAASKLPAEDTIRLILNNRVADIIKENKVMLYAELMQWANRANFGEVR